MVLKKNWRHTTLQKWWESATPSLPNWLMWLWWVSIPTWDLADELRKLMKMKMSAVKMLVASFLPLISIRLDTTHLLFSHSVSSFVCAPTSRPKSDLMDSKLQWTEIFPHLNLELPQPLNVTPYLAPPDALPFVWQARGHLVAAGWEGGWVEGGEGRWLQARGAGRGTGCKAAGKKTICD